MLVHRGSSLWRNYPSITLCTYPLFSRTRGMLPADMFDPSVFDIRMVMGVLVCVALLAYAIFRLFVRK